MPETTKAAPVPGFVEAAITMTPTVQDGAARSHRSPPAA
jgi:hypothetical protein